MTLLLQVLAIALGGAIGAVLRWGIGELCSILQARRSARGRRTDSTPSTVPWHTVTANVLACFMLGMIVVKLASASGTAQLVYLFGAVGFCGGLSTLSTAALDAVSLVRGGNPVTATGYLLTTVGACMGALWLGVVIAI